mgnify:CR=1 FL=1
MNTSRSKQLLERARRVIPGGVNSPVRAFGSVGGQARFIRSASGARIEDEDGNEFENGQVPNAISDKLASFIQRAFSPSTAPSPAPPKDAAKTAA